MRRDAQQGCGTPREPRPAAALQRPEQRQERRQREEEEEAVHAGVDSLEEKHPAAGQQHRCDERGPASSEAAGEERDERQAGDGERGGDEADAAEPEAEVGDGPGEQEVQGGAAALPRDVLDDPCERVAADEQRQRLVLVGRPGHQLVQQEGGRGDGRHGHADPEPVCVQERPRREALGPFEGSCFGALCHRFRDIFAGRLAPRCRSTNTVARTGTRSRCSSG